jgi:hypothetical protein
MKKDITQDCDNEGEIDDRESEIDDKKCRHDKKGKDYKEGEIDDEEGEIDDTWVAWLSVYKQVKASTKVLAGLISQYMNFVLNFKYNSDAGKDECQGTPGPQQSQAHISEQNKLNNVSHIS